MRQAKRSNSSSGESVGTAGVALAVRQCLIAAVALGLAGCAGASQSPLRITLNAADVPYDPGYRVYADWDGDGVPNRFDGRPRRPGPF